MDIDMAKKSVVKNLKSGDFRKDMENYTSGLQTTEMNLAVNKGKNPVLMKASSSGHWEEQVVGYQFACECGACFDDMNDLNQHQFAASLNGEQGHSANVQVPITERVWVEDPEPEPEETEPEPEETEPEPETPSGGDDSGGGSGQQQEETPPSNSEPETPSGSGDSGSGGNDGNQGQESTPPPSTTQTPTETPTTETPTESPTESPTTERPTEETTESPSGTSDRPSGSTDRPSTTQTPTTESTPESDVDVADPTDATEEEGSGKRHGFWDWIREQVDRVRERIRSISSTFGLSFEPIMRRVRDFVGAETAVGKRLDGIADDLYGDSDTTNPINSSLKDSLDAAAASMDKEGVADITEVMRTNGKDVASQGLFMVAADMNDKSFELLNQFADTNMSAMRDTIDGMAGEDGMLSQEDQQMVFEEYKNLLMGYSAYGEGAVEGINELYDTDTDSIDKATDGLHKVMESEATPLYESIREFEEKYGLTDEQKKELDAIEVEGMPKYSEYQTLAEREAAAEKESSADKESGKEGSKDDKDKTGKDKDKDASEDESDGKESSSVEDSQDGKKGSVKKAAAVVKPNRGDVAYNRFGDVVEAANKGMSGPVMERE